MMFSWLNPIPSLPQYTGPYKVGVTDYEIPTSEIESNSFAPDPRVTTIKFRIYYPTTPDAVASEPVYWLPEPQKQWNEAYASFVAGNARWTPLVSKLWSLTNYIKIPVVKNTPLLSSKTGPYPVCFFSHGLGGNTNIYSSIVGSLASCGVVVIAPEHRDGSCPVAFIRNAKGDIETTIQYKNLAHKPEPKIFNARHTQMRIRLWELELTYTVIKAMNEGATFTNYAEEGQPSDLDLKARLNFQPGKVTWTGHSFGAATVTQFVKSVFYHQYLPSTKEPRSDDQEWDLTPLNQIATDGDLVKQITPESPLALLDIWPMPLRGKAAEWLWERPLPCYSRNPDPDQKPNTVAIISGEFHSYELFFKRTRAILSRFPDKAMKMLESDTETETETLNENSSTTAAASNKSTMASIMPELSTQEARAAAASSPPSSKTTTPHNSSPPSPHSTPSTPSSASSASSSASSSLTTPTSSQSSLHTHPTPTPAPQLYHLPHTAHLSQSDFGPLFPSSTRLAIRSLSPADAHKTTESTVHAVLTVLHNAGLLEQEGKGEVDVSAPVTEREKRGGKHRWIRVPLVQDGA